MFPFNRLAMLALAGTVFAVFIVFACGPDFGIEALQDRQSTVLAPPSISFEAELRSLVAPPKDKFQVVEKDSENRTVPSRASLDTAELPADAATALVLMGQQTSGDAAYGLCSAVPEAVRLYAAGAVSFLHSDYGGASSYFQRVLALPTPGRQIRELWARFMLGRIAVQGGNNLEANAQFEATRALVRNGASDPLGLAIASFGEQARGAWKGGDVANAVDLYARQAAYGSASGANSLVVLAGRILNDANLLNQAVQNSTSRRLLFICLNNNSGRRFFTDPSPNALAGAKVDRVVSALEQYGPKQVDGAGLLASAAYSQGRFDVAQRLSDLDDAPISAWVQAKLALRKGDQKTALRDYERALKTSQATPDIARTLQAESGVLRVSRRDYVQALDIFYQATANQPGLSSGYPGLADYWGDAAYLAERVFTIQELQKYVDGASASDSGSSWRGPSEKSQLRAILARRLMRAEQRHEAFRYFDDPKVRSLAQQYDAALNKAASWWCLPVMRAEAWFTAATLARKNGMELLGFEEAPDFAVWSGELEPGPPAADRTPDPYKSQDEQQRVAASKPARNVRFQYRLTAVDHALRAANSLPPRSQAFAAVLCDATRWIIDRQPDRARQIYAMYLHKGAYVAWGRTFGRSCPQPDFAELSLSNSAVRRIKSLTRHARARPLPLAIAVVGALVLLTVATGYMRARRGKRLVE